MDEIQIREMLSTDLEDIMEIEKLSFSLPWSQESFITELENNPAARYLVAINNKRVVGYAGFWKIIDEGHITNIAVHPSSRRKGIGEKLLEALLEKSKEEGIVKLTLEVRRSNFSAIHLYEKFEFQTLGHRKGYYSDNNEDALIMWKG